MKLQTKLLLSVGLIFLVSFVITQTIHYRNVKKDVVSNLRQKAKDIRDTLTATWRVYHRQFHNSSIPLNEKTIVLLPAYALSRISDDFKNGSQSGLTFNNVTDRPRNPKNAADLLEMEAIKYFRVNRTKKERFVPFKSTEGELFYHFSSPIWIEKHCLQCHGKREDAPQTIRDLYDTAFDYELGDLRGIMSIKLPAKNLLAIAWADFKQNLLVNLIAFLSIFCLISWMIRRYVTVPIVKLTKGLQTVADGNDDQSIVGLSGEMSVLGDTFNEMAETIKKRETELLGKTKHIKVINEITKIINAKVEIKEIFPPLISQLTKLINFSRASIALYDETEHAFHLSLVYVKSGKTELGEDVVLPGLESPPGWVLENKRSLIRVDLEKEQRFPLDLILLKEGYKSHFCFPLESKKRIFGTLNIASECANGFEKQEVKLIEDIAEQIAIAVERFRLYEETKSFAANLELRVNERTVELKERVSEVEQLNKGMVNLLEDIQAAYQRTGKLAEKLQDTNRELESFSYTISHDLRAPLRAINGFSKIVSEDYVDQLGSEGQRYFGLIQDNVRKMGDLIDDLLEFSRLGRKRMNINDMIDMGELAQSVFNELKFNFPERVIQLSIETLPRIYGDRSMIRQLFVNILSNSMKYTEPRETAVIELGSKIVKNQHAFYVKDNGVGFDMQYVGKLFGVFQRLHSVEEFDGTGVGLAIAQRIVERHGGQIWAESEIDKGTTIYFSLPQENVNDGLNIRDGAREMINDRQDEITHRQEVKEGYVEQKGS